MPPKRTRTRICPGSTSGVGTSSTRRSRAAWMTRASMSCDSFAATSNLKRGRDAAIDVQDVAVDETGRIARQENGRADQVFHVAPAARRRAVDQPAAELRVAHQGLGQFGLEVAGAQAVDLDAVGAQSIAMPLVSIFTAPLLA